jgi:hypothetical protein
LKWKREEFVFNWIWDGSFEFFKITESDQKAMRLPEMSLIDEKDSGERS